MAQAQSARMKKKPLKMPHSPESMSLWWGRSQGMIVAKTSWTVPYSFTKQDLYGYADNQQYDPLSPAVFNVQATTLSNLHARVNKILASPLAMSWVMENFRLIHVEGWKYEGRDTYSVRIIQVGRIGLALKAMSLWDERVVRGRKEKADLSPLTPPQAKPATPPKKRAVDPLRSDSRPPTGAVSCTISTGTTAKGGRVLGAGKGV